MYVGDYGDGVRDAVSNPVARRGSHASTRSKSARISVARINRHADTRSRTKHCKSVDGYIRQRIFDVFDSAGELAMNDAMIAAEVQAEDGKEAHDFVELGNFSEETRGSLGGDFYDGGMGKFNP
jgi:hypothetical protein